MLALLASGASAALADLAPIGAPFTGHSWGQRFQIFDPMSFDLIAVRMTTPGSRFESPTFREFGPQDSWDTTYEIGAPTPTLAVAQGSLLETLDCDVLFSGDVTEALEFDFVAFRGNTLLESVHAAWSGGKAIWRLGPSDWQPNRYQLIPAPGAALLGLAGWAVVGALKRRLT